MGAWGTGSLDNDAALDILPEFFNFKLLKKITKSDHYYEQIIAASEVALHMNKLSPIIMHSFGENIASNYVLKLGSILEDKAWIDDWNEDCRADVVKNIKRLIRGLKKIVD